MNIFERIISIFRKPEPCTADIKKPESDIIEVKKDPPRSPYEKEFVEFFSGKLDQDTFNLVRKVLNNGGSAMYAILGSLILDILDKYEEFSDDPESELSDDPRYKLGHALMWIQNAQRQSDPENTSPEARGYISRTEYELTVPLTICNIYKEMLGRQIDLNTLDKIIRPEFEIYL